MYFTNRFHLVKQLNDHNVVKFKDPLVEQLLIQHNPSLKQGNITLYDLAQYKNINDIFYMSKIQYFDEFKYFTGITYIGGYKHFQDCYKLKTLTLPPSIKYFYNYSITGTLLKTIVISTNQKITIQSNTIINNHNLKTIIIKADDIAIPYSNEYTFFQDNHYDLKIYCKPKVYYKLVNVYIDHIYRTGIDQLVKYENENELPKL